MRTAILILSLLLPIAPVRGQDAQPANLANAANVGMRQQASNPTQPRNCLLPQPQAGCPRQAAVAGGSASAVQAARMPYGSGYEARMGGMGGGRTGRGRGR